MSESKYTPGPWSPSIRKGQQIVVRGPQTECIAVIPSPTFDEFGLVSGSERDANASLIAAAPDLLEQLRDAEELLTQTLRWRGENWECTEEELLGPIRSAIAKAEGES